jgi:hypothetical protein
MYTHVYLHHWYAYIREARRKEGRKVPVLVSQHLDLFLSLMKEGRKEGH